MAWQETARKTDLSGSRRCSNKVCDHLHRLDNDPDISDIRWLFYYPVNNRRKANEKWDQQISQEQDTAVPNRTESAGRPSVSAGSFRCRSYARPEKSKIFDIRCPTRLLHLPVSSIRIFEIPDETRRRKLALTFLEPLDGIWSDSGLGSISFSPLQMKQNSQTNTKTGCPDSLPWPTNNTSVTQTKDTHFHLRRKNDEKTVDRIQTT